ncbi:MAG: RIP metalloprotease RseP [Paracoccaceae bacterium]
MDTIGLIPSFGGFLYTVAAFVIALLIIVAIHEFGHYIVGRWSGIHAEVFSLGFGPVIWSRMDKRGTRWQLAALPFGGFVKFLGDSNAASGKDEGALHAMAEGERRRSMHGAPLWARAATVAAGPVFNFILSIIVFAAIIGVRGLASDPLTIAELRPVPVEQGLQVGDEVLAIAGIDTPELAEFDSFIDKLPSEAVLDYTVNRNGAVLTVPGPHPYPPIISSLTPGSAAMDIDLRVGDVIESVDGTSVATFAQLRDIVGASDGKPMLLKVWRDGTVMDFTLAPRRMDLPDADGGFETRWLIGISGGMVFVPMTESPGILTSVGYGAEQTWFIMKSSISGLTHVISGAISSCNIRGPIGIAQTSGEIASQGLTSFIWFIAVLSTAVGLLNLFPVPVLDGGHLVFHAYEAVVGKPPSDGALRVLMTIGFALLLTMMGFALMNDLTCP